MPLSFANLADKNSTRVNRWHKAGLAEWTPSDWAVAMAGEAGEVCNAIKKLNRIRDESPAISVRFDFASEKECIAAIGAELADTVIYLDLLAQRLGLDLATEVIKKFNLVSDKYGFPEKL